MVWSIEWVFWIDVFMYIYIYRELPCRVKPFCFFLREINLSWNYSLLFILFQLPFEVTCSHHVLHLLYRVNRRQSRKPLLYYFLCKKKQLCCEKCFYCVFITAKGVTTPWSNSKTIFIILFFGRLFILTMFHFVPIFNGFIPLMIVYAIVCVC